MRYILTILFLNFGAALCQDTTLIHQSSYGNYSIRVSTKTDTSEIGYYSKGKTEYTIQKDKTSKKNLYTRFYRNGKKMWVKEWRSETENGKCTYYNPKGLKVAEFNYSSGEITDTLFLAPDTYILFGKLTYSSTVYGGMQREDGSSNISEMSGPYMNLHIKLIRLDPPAGQQREEFYFTSDFQGEFIVILKPGNYGLFQKDFSTKDVIANMFSPQSKPSGSMHETWNINSPIIIQKNNKISYCNFENSSVGYAP